MVGYMRIFMGAARDRLDALSVSPSASTSAHMRALTLVLCILTHDLVGITALINNLGAMSATKALLCAFDMAIVAVEGFKVRESRQYEGRCYEQPHLSPGAAGVHIRHCHAAEEGLFRGRRG